MGDIRKLLKKCVDNAVDELGGFSQCQYCPAKARRASVLFIDDYCPSRREDFNNIYERVYHKLSGLQGWSECACRMYTIFKIAGIRFDEGICLNSSKGVACDSCARYLTRILRGSSGISSCPNKI